ncbi:unnamed protein product, partial [Polarella glacialis]
DLLHLLPWLQRLASPARLAFQGLQVPPPEGEGWLGPVECSDSSWQMSLWYRWSSSTVISTVSRLSLPGNLCEVLSMFRESDLVHNWLPFVTGADCAWSEEVPALMSSIHAKIPILPVSLTTVIHRAFIDAFDEAPSGSGGVLLVEWSPSPEDVDRGRYCGIRVPVAPAQSSIMQVKLAKTLVCNDGEDMPGRGYRDRIQADSQVTGSCSQVAIVLAWEPQRLQRNLYRVDGMFALLSCKSSFSVVMGTGLEATRVCIMSRPPLLLLLLFVAGCLSHGVVTELPFVNRTEVQVPEEPDVRSPSCPPSAAQRFSKGRISLPRQQRAPERSGQARPPSPNRSISTLIVKSKNSQGRQKQDLAERHLINGRPSDDSSQLGRRGCAALLAAVATLSLGVDPSAAARRRLRQTTEHFVRGITMRCKAEQYSETSAHGTGGFGYSKAKGFSQPVFPRCGGSTRALVKGNLPPKTYGLGKQFAQAADCINVSDCAEIGRQKAQEEFGVAKDMTFQMTPDKVRYKDMVAGVPANGVAKLGDNLQLKYKVMRQGKRAYDGLSGEASTIFSLGFGEDDGPKDAFLTAKLGEGRFVKALEEGLLGMAVGSTRRVQVRPENGFGWQKPRGCAEKIEAVGVLAGLPMGGAENNNSCLNEEKLPQPVDFAAKRRFARRFDESLIVELQLVGLS